MAPRAIFGFFIGLVLGLTLLASSCDREESHKPPGAQDEVKMGPRIGATCIYSHSSKDDPIVKPTSEPPAHEHLFYGNTSTNQNSTSETLRASGTLCKQVGDKSAWWVPQTYWGADKLKTDKLLIYYEETKSMDVDAIRPFPRGFQAIGRQASFRCGAAGAEFTTRPLRSCGASTIALRVDFNQCYNPNSRVVESNLVGTVNGSCPRPHTTLLPHIQVQQNLRIPDSSGPLRVAGNEGVMSATSAHADFINAWDQPRLKTLIEDCLKNTAQDEVRPEQCRTADEEG